MSNAAPLAFGWGFSLFLDDRQFRRIAARRGRKRAAIVVGRSVLIVRLVQLQI
ncbi:MAG: hypothetical protein MJA27_10595 [Pseudanabaenales cyanobacterium]|nr:hypothetical protein [Pseudanabaenales cyanobacterium]